MDDCGCNGLASVFDRRHAERARERYARNGPDPTTATLLAMLRARGVGGATVLDVGGETGVIDRELLRTGAERAVLVDASSAGLAVAREEAMTAGLADRLETVAGDFASVAPAIEPADVVTLDRVICCYPDVHALVRLSSARAKRLYGLVLPRDRWLVRLGIGVENALSALRRHRYRAFAHPNALVDELAAEVGLRPTEERFTWLWRVVVYER